MVVAYARLSGYCVPWSTTSRFLPRLVARSFLVDDDCEIGDDCEMARLEMVAAWRKLGRVRQWPFVMMYAVRSGKRYDWHMSRRPFPNEP